MSASNTSNKMSLERLSKSMRSFHNFCLSEQFKQLQQKAAKIGCSLIYSSYSVPYENQNSGDLAWNVYQFTIKNGSNELIHKTFNDFEQSHLQNLVWWIEHSLYQLNKF